MSISQAFLMGSGVSITGALIGSAFAVDQSSATPTLTVPAGTVTGHTLIAILRCRGDRSFTIPGGWTVHRNTVLPVGATGDTTNTRLYIVSKAFAGETSVSFTHSAAAAYGYALLSVKGNVITDAFNQASAPTITKTAAGTLLLAVWTNSSSATSDATPMTNFGAQAYTNLGTTSFLQTGTYFHLAQAWKKDGAPAGSATASPNLAGTGTWLAEIGS